MYLQNVIKEVFTELGDVLRQIGAEQYGRRSNHLNSSIGQHVRHTIEFFQALMAGYEAGFVNYDKRKRDLLIETDKSVAIRALNEIEVLMDRPNKKIVLEAVFGAQNGSIMIESNFERELAYNLEHAIHHMALIRVGLNELTDIAVSETFGVAASTLKYRAECAQ